jgi:hypothetical protein
VPKRHNNLNEICANGNPNLRPIINDIILLDFMSLNPKEVENLRQYLTSTRPILDQAAKGLITTVQATRIYNDLWRGALEAIPESSDEWKIIDRADRGTARWFHQSTNGYITGFDQVLFKKFEETITGVLDIYKEGPPTVVDGSKTHQLFLPTDEYGAKRVVMSLLKRANRTLIIIDSYLDDMVFDFLDVVEPVVEIKILTGDKKPIFRSLFLSFIKTGRKAEAKVNKDCHDRFVIIDGASIFHIGASLNTIGKKTFMISEVLESTEKQKLLDQYSVWWNTGIPVV